MHFSPTASCQGIYINKCRESINSSSSSSSCNKTSKFMYRSIFCNFTLLASVISPFECIKRWARARWQRIINSFILYSVEAVSWWHTRNISPYPSLLLLPLTYLKIDASAKSIFNFCRSWAGLQCAYTQYALCQFKWLAVTCSDYVGGAALLLLHVGINRREAGRQIAGAAPKSPGLGSFLFKTHLRRLPGVATTVWMNNSHKSGFKTSCCRTDTLSE
jgi:hypothetical protein